MKAPTRSRPDIAVVGSANLDLVVDVLRIPVAGETVLGGDLRRIPGGKGANQAVAAARLGREVSMIGRVGDDDAAAMLRSVLEESGVDASALRVTPNTSSGVAMIAVADDGDNAIVVSPGANRRLGVSDVRDAAEVLSNASVVLLQLEVPADAVAEAARLASGTVVLNPAPAPTSVLPTDLLQRVDVLVPNETELAALAAQTGLSSPMGPVDTETAVALARGLPVASVVVTLGAAGAIVVTSSDATHIAAPDVVPVDTTAAGDAFCGALADALCEGADLLSAARWGVRVGAATTLRPGAQTSLPTRREVDDLLAPFSPQTPR